MHVSLRSNIPKKEVYSRIDGKKHDGKVVQAQKSCIAAFGMTQK